MNGREDGACKAIAVSTDTRALALGSFKQKLIKIGPHKERSNGWYRYCMVETREEQTVHFLCDLFTCLCFRKPALVGFFFRTLSFISRLAVSTFKYNDCFKVPWNVPQLTREPLSTLSTRNKIKGIDSVACYSHLSFDPVFLTSFCTSA